MLTPKSHAIANGFNALVVEDEVLIAFTIQDYLTDLGATSVSVTHDSDQAMRSMAHTVFDTAVIDWMLGRQTSEGIVRALNNSGTGVVIVTGMHHEAVPEELRVRNHMITKPFDIVGFNQAVLASLGTPRTRD